MESPSWLPEFRVCAWRVVSLDALTMAALEGDVRTAHPGAAIVTSCQRLEAYGFEPCVCGAPVRLDGRAALERLAGVAAGLDSVVIGEAQIAGQVRAAFRGTRGPLRAAADVALGPADDGGFYAIAMRRADPHMFHGVRWSGPETLAETVRAIERCGLSVELGPPWYDVDTVQDLARLAASPLLPPRTARWLLELPGEFRMRPTMEI
ncbi:MAG: DUF2064 domain-containing protein [Bryobacteraceae bacterium]|nr:DUF2064 domain-containing protein [Bryobacteraceae bacterium]